MLVVFISLIILGFFLAVPAALFIVYNQDQAKKTAQKILNGQPYQPDLLVRTLRTLATTQDNEGKRLYSKLADFAEKRNDCR